MRNEAWRTLEQALRPYLERGDVWTMQLETYDPEVERYGGPEAIEAAEGFFTADSDLAVSLVELDANRASDWREQFAVASVDALLTDFSFDLAERVAWSRSVRDALFADLGLGHDAMIGFGRCFRPVKGSLERLLGPFDDGRAGRLDDSEQDTHGVIRAALRIRSPEGAAFAATLRDLERGGRLTASVSGVAASLAHMSVNRLVPRSPRIVEAAILDFLHRLYSAAAARTGRTRASQRNDRPSR